MRWRGLNKAWARLCSALPPQINVRVATWCNASAAQRPEMPSQPRTKVIPLLQGARNGAGMAATKQVCHVSIDVGIRKGGVRKHPRTMSRTHAPPPPPATYTRTVSVQVCRPPRWCTACYQRIMHHPPTPVSPVQRTSVFWGTLRRGGRPRCRWRGRRPGLQSVTPQGEGERQQLVHVMKCATKHTTGVQVRETGPRCRRTTLAPKDVAAPAACTCEPRWPDAVVPLSTLGSDPLDQVPLQHGPAATSDAAGWSDRATVPTMFAGGSCSQGQQTDYVVECPHMR